MSCDQSRKIMITDSQDAIVVFLQKSNFEDFFCNSRTQVNCFERKKRTRGYRWPNHHLISTSRKINLPFNFCLRPHSSSPRNIPHWFHWHVALYSTRSPSVSINRNVVLKKEEWTGLGSTSLSLSLPFSLQCQSNQRSSTHTKKRRRRRRDWEARKKLNHLVNHFPLSLLPLRYPLPLHTTKLHQFLSW